MIALILGQSNSANHGDSVAIYSASENVYEYCKGYFLQAADPFLCGTGDGSSVWGRFGDMLSNRTYIKKVIFIPTGIGGQSIAQLLARTEHQADPLSKVLAEIKERKIQVSHVFFHQGEADAKAKTSFSDYKTTFLKFYNNIRQAISNKPLFLLSIASKGCDNDPSYDEISDAQLDLIKNHETIDYGPNTDNYSTPEYRFDGYHFNEKGFELFAEDLLQRTIDIQ